jgi:tetrahydromethanopterin S-methyltransferase subunit B
MDSEITYALRKINERIDALEKKFQTLEMDLRFKADPANDPLNDLPGRGKHSTFGKIMGL